jgi:hypothetical protein
MVENGLSFVKEAARGAAACHIKTLGNVFFRAKIGARVGETQEVLLT